MTYLLSLLMKIDKKVSASHKPQGLLFTQRKKGKSKGMAESSLCPGTGSGCRLEGGE
jgi:hypothetical protein